MNDRIMIIEDNANIRIELMNFFERNEFETVAVEAFETVEDIISKVLEESPKLLLLDINLGEVSGFDLCRGRFLMGTIGGAFGLFFLIYSLYFAATYVGYRNGVKE